MQADPTAPHVVCLLADQGYFHGAAALANSLVRNGFKGHIVVGFRGACRTGAARSRPHLARHKPSLPA